MSKRDASRDPPEPPGRGAPGADGVLPDGPLGADEEQQLTVRVTEGDCELESLLSALTPRLLTSLAGQGRTLFVPAGLGPPIRDGLRDALLEHCPRGQPDDGLGHRAL